ncbi:hypothetical protein L1887_09334 [Cichorium endivia]|nr:hypothetical protein L1887_09334 [Cichorium endivia]
MAYPPQPSILSSLHLSLLPFHIALAEASYKLFVGLARGTWKKMEFDGDKIELGEGGGECECELEGRRRAMTSGSGGL